MGIIATTARSRTTGKKNVKKESVKMNHANTCTEKFIGQKHMLWTQAVKKVNKRDCSQFFTNELDGTRHSSSKRHSSIDSKFVLSFDCNLQQILWNNDAF